MTATQVLVLDAGESGFALAESSAQRLYNAHHALRGVLRRPAAGREREWAFAVSEHLDRTLFTLQQYRGEVRGPHCDYEDLCLQAQWMVPRIQKLIANFEETEAHAGMLKTELGEVLRGRTELANDVRDRAFGLLARLRRALREESAIEFERLDEPPALD